MKVADFLWGKVPSGLATLALVLLGLTGDTDKPWSWEQPFHEGRPWWGILAVAAFLVVHLIVSTWRANQQSRQLSGSREAIQRNVLHLISDISGLAGKEYDLWMVDLYLARRVVKLRWRWPYVYDVILERSLSSALKDVREVEGHIGLDDRFFGKSFLDSRAALWWDNDLTFMPVAQGNSAEQLAAATNRKLKGSYGVIKVGPIVDELGGNCRGILVVHSSRDVETAMKALGVLAQEEADRHLSRACGNIHAQIAR